MKRTLIIMSLAVLLIMPLIIAGCDGGTTLTDSDVAAIQGFGTRLDSHDSSIATINNTLNSLDTETLNGLAALDADDLAALLALSLATVPTDVSQLKTDMITLKGTTSDIEDRVEALENGDSSDDGTVVSGEVTVTLDEEAPFQILSNAVGTTPYRFTVTVTNGTDDYQTVSYWVIFDCASHAGGAVLTDIPVLYISAMSFGGGGCAFEYTLVPSTGLTTQQILFTPCAGFEIVVPKGKTVTVYHTIDVKTDITEVWQISLAGVTVTEL